LRIRKCLTGFIAVIMTVAIPSRAEGLIQGHENWFGLSVPSSPKYRASEDTWITSAAGYISSSTEDLGRYLQMYINGGEEIISEESINEMFYNSVPVKDDIPYEYGMGWNRRRCDHDGCRGYLSRHGFGLKNYEFLQKQEIVVGVYRKI